MQQLTIPGELRVVGHVVDYDKNAIHLIIIFLLLKIFDNRFVLVDHLFHFVVLVFLEIASLLFYDPGLNLFLCSP